MAIEILTRKNTLNYNHNVHSVYKHGILERSFDELSDDYAWHHAVELRYKLQAEEDNELNEEE